MLGLGWINCYHEVKPFYRWEDKPEHEFTQEENAEQYELYQKQRAFERKIRKYKRLKVVNKDNDKDKYKMYSDKLKNTNKEFSAFLDENNLRRDYSREFVSLKKVINELSDVPSGFEDKSNEILKVKKVISNNLLKS